VPAPVAVRYAWDDYPIGCNLYNAAGLPAAPFRSDTWDALSDIAQKFTGK
jgi:sialate O-acetylesterase